jgi:hypothetical protein
MREPIAIGSWSINWSTAIFRLIPEYAKIETPWCMTHVLLWCGFSVAKETRKKRTIWDEQP